MERAIAGSISAFESTQFIPEDVCDCGAFKKLQDADGINPSFLMYTQGNRMCCTVEMCYDI